LEAPTLVVVAGPAISIPLIAGRIYKTIFKERPAWLELKVELQVRA
jgi:hypothetical protein